MLSVPCFKPYPQQRWLLCFSNYVVVVQMAFSVAFYWMKIVIKALKPLVLSCFLAKGFESLILHQLEINSFKYKVLFGGLFLRVLGYF